MAEKLGPAFAVSRVGAATKYGGTTYTIKVHFHTRDHAETVRRLLEEEPLPPGPFPAQFAAQAELIDTQKLEQALAWLGCSAPSGEILSWWVGREVNHLLDAVLEQRAQVQRSRGGQVRSAADVVQLLVDALCLARPDVPISTWSIVQDAIKAGQAYLAAGVKEGQSG
jgi:hypothetical protein